MKQINNGSDDVLVKQPLTHDQNKNTEFTQVNIVPSLIKAFGLQFFVAIMLKVAQDLLKFVSPQILKKLILFTQAEDISEGMGNVVLCVFDFN